MRMATPFGEPTWPPWPLTGEQRRWPRSSRRWGGVVVEARRPESPHKGDDARIKLCNISKSSCTFSTYLTCEWIHLNVVP